VTKRLALALLILAFCVSTEAQQTNEPQNPPASQNPPAPANPPAPQNPPEPQTAPEPQIPEPPSAPEPPRLPIAELYGGYTYVSADPFSTNTRVRLDGWEATLSLNVVRWLGLVADFGTSYGNAQIPVAVPTPFPPCPPLCPTSTTNLTVNTRLFTYLFGARVPYRRWKKFTPYAQGLFGKAHVKGSILGVSESDSKFAIALGLGADYRISQRLAWRVQADYLRTRFFSYYEDNYRVSTGIVLNFTHKKKRRTLTTP